MGADDEPTTDEDSVVAVFANTEDASQAIERLRRCGVDAHDVSVVGRSFHVDEQPTGYYSLGNGPRYLGRAQEFWGELLERAKYEAFLWVPGAGLLVVAGPILEPLLTQLRIETPRAGNMPLAAALVAVGVLPTMARKYEMAINGDMVLVMFRGQSEAVGRAVAAMSRVPKLELEVYAAMTHQG